LTLRERGRYDARVPSRSPQWEAPPRLALARCSSLVILAAGVAIASTAAALRASAQEANAADARLTIETTPGARLAFDGSPAPTPIEGAQSARPMSAGVHTIRIERRGYMARTEQILLERGESRTLFAPLAPKTRRGAIARATLVPGWGSHYMDRPAVGWGLAAAAVAGAAGAIAYDRQMAGRVDDYESRLAEYGQAVVPERQEETYRAAQEAFGKVDDSRSARNASIAILAGAYALSVAEALFRYPFSRERDDAPGADRGSLGPRLDDTSSACSFASGGARITLLRVSLRSAAR